ncbi:MAG: peptide ABC transporter substrate-binding protein, partial [Chloroflexaceae bacterium]|nr:peptide ABC transporter substrate-binding protein [Chloroflexaceae bacterium]
MNVLPTPRLATLSLAATLLMLVLVGCASVSGPSDPPVPTAVVVPTATPLPRGGNLTVRMAADVPDLRPWQPRSRAEEQISGLLYSGLMRLDDKLRPQPDLAEGFAASADGRVLTFTLRSGLTWHDGVPLEAADVQFTLERMRGLPFTSTALLADLRYISAVATPTTSTVVLSLTERYAPLLSHLTLPILPRHLLTDRDIGNTNFWDVPVGSGPFQFEQRQPGQSVVLARFDNFHRGAPLLDRVAFALADTPEASIEALRDGRLQLAEVPWSASRSISGTLPGVQVGSYPENGYYFLGFNMREGSPFADVRVRQALVRAIDLPRLVEGVTQGQGLPLGSSAVPGSWADFTPPPGAGSNTDEARALLDAAGWPLPEGATIRARDGVTLTARLFVRGDDERRVAAAQRIAEAAASIGMQLAVEPADFGSVIISKYVPPYDFELLLGSWSNGAGDP